jgi:hypothetical protein
LNQITQLMIVNRGLQLVGSQPISSLQENSRGARAMNRAYYPVLWSLLRMGIWGFAKKRIQIAASSTPPAFGKANYYPLPGDFLDMAPPDDTFNNNYSDWEIEGNQIASDDSSPIYVKYISSDVTEGMFDACFAEAFSASLAMNTCEEITQSNTKLVNIEKIFDAQIGLAKQRNAFEKRPITPATDTWISKRA